MSKCLFLVKAMPILVGISRSIYGLNGSESSKRAATKERMAQFAAQVGIPAAEMRARSGRHVYYTGNTLPSTMKSIGIVASCAEDGYGNLMFTASRLNDRAGRAAGDWNTTIKNFLSSKHNDPVLSTENARLAFCQTHAAIHSSISTQCAAARYLLHVGGSQPS